MNTKILQKCVEELNKDEPNISYIKGMLETVIEMTNIPTGVPVYPSQIFPSVPYQVTSVQPLQEEGSGLVEVYAGNPGAIGSV